MSERAFWRGREIFSVSAAETMQTIIVDTSDDETLWHLFGGKRMDWQYKESHEIQFS